MAWQGALFARIESLDEPLPVPASTLGIPAYDRSGECTMRSFNTGPEIEYPTEALFRYGVGAVVAPLRSGCRRRHPCSHDRRIDPARRAGRSRRSDAPAMASREGPALCGELPHPRVVLLHGAIRASVASTLSAIPPYFEVSDENHPALRRCAAPGRTCSPNPRGGPVVAAHRVGRDGSSRRLEPHHAGEDRARRFTS